MLREMKANFARLIGWKSIGEDVSVPTRSPGKSTSMSIGTALDALARRPLTLAMLGFLASVAAVDSPALANKADPDIWQQDASAALSLLAADGYRGSVLVACGDRVLFEAVHEPGNMNNVAVSYWIASVSKQFTAAAILILEQRGRLSLADSVGKFFPDAPSDKSELTLLALLTHQSGLPQTYPTDGIEKRSQALNAIFDTPLEHHPGSRYSYSNENYVLLAMLVEIVSGERFESFLEREIFLPAGIRDWGFWPDLSRAFVPPLINPRDAGKLVPNWGFRGATGIRLSTRDLHRWVLALQNDTVLSSQNRQMLFGEHVAVGNGETAGFGWHTSYQEGKPSWLSARGSESYGANALVYVSKVAPLTIIATSHAGPRRGAGWSRRARDILMEKFASSGSHLCR